MPKGSGPIDAAELAALQRLAAHLAELPLDAETLEIVMAALTAEECDQVDV